MTRKSTINRKSTIQAPKALPNSRDVLAFLLRSTEKVLDFLVPTQHGQRIRLKELRLALREPSRIVEQRQFLKAVGDANQKHFAQGSPPLAPIMAYLDGGQLNGLLAQRKSALARSKALRLANPEKVQDWRPCIEAFAEMVELDEAVIGLFRALQRQVIARLDDIAPTGADNGADNKQNPAIKLPRNPQVVELALKLDRRKKGVTQREVAIAVTDGDERLAANLLRQVRRFRDLIKKRPR